MKKSNLTKYLIFIVFVFNFGYSFAAPLDPHFEIMKVNGPDDTNAIKLGEQRSCGKPIKFVYGKVPIGIDKINLSAQLSLEYIFHPISAEKRTLITEVTTLDFNELLNKFIEHSVKNRPSDSCDSFHIWGQNISTNKGTAVLQLNAKYTDNKCWSYDKPCCTGQSCRWVLGVKACVPKCGMCTESGYTKIASDSGTIFTNLTPTIEKDSEDKFTPPKVIINATSGDSGFGNIIPNWGLNLIGIASFNTLSKLYLDNLRSSLSQMRARLPIWSEKYSRDDFIDGQTSFEPVSASFIGQNADLKLVIKSEFLTKPITACGIYKNIKHEIEKK
jgi:hypothetical protein